MLDTSSEAASATFASLWAETKFGLEVTLIADGVLDDGESALVSLVVLPRLLDEGESGGVELAHWPELLHKAFADPANPADDKRVTVGGFPVRARRIGLPKKMPSYEALNKAWRHALRLDDFREATAMAAMVARATEKDAPARETKIQQPFAILGYDTCSLARQMGRLHGALSALQAARLIALDNASIGQSELLFLNNHSSAGLQSTSAMALFTNGTEQISLADQEPEGFKSDDQIHVSQIEVKQRIAWSGRVRPGAAEQIGFTGNPSLGRGRRQEQHQPQDVPMNQLLANTIDGLIKAGIERQGRFQQLFHPSALRDLPTAGQIAEVFSGFDDIPLANENNEREEAYQRVLSGLSATFLSDDDLARRDAMRKSGSVHQIDLARGAYEIAMMPEMKQFKRALSPSQNGGKVEPIETGIRQEKERFDRRVSGLLAYPEVARAFGLIVDFKVPVADIENVSGDKTELRMRGGPQNSKMAATRRVSAVAFSAGKNARFEAKSIFYSADHSDLVEHLDPLFADGVVRMKETHRLLTIDVNQAYEGAANAAGSDQSALDYGEPLDRVTSAMTSPRIAGLALVDAAREQRVELDLILSNLDETKPDRPLYLEDVVTGYRVDVGRVEAGGEITWAQGSQRRLKFPGLTDRLGVDLGIAPPETSTRDRMSGSVRSPHRLISMESTREQPIVVPFQTICTWRNWTFGSPSIAQKASIQDDDLQIDVQYSVDPAGPKMMRQRIGETYVMGARTVAMNGSSLSFDEASTKYKEPSNIASEGPEHEDSVRANGLAAIPSPDRYAMPIHGRSGGYPVYRHEPINAPNLFLNAKNAPGQDNPRVAPEHDSHLNEIIATNQSPNLLKWPATPRYLLVGGSSFDQCLMNGALDRFKKALPGDSYATLRTWPDRKIEDHGDIQNPTVANGDSLPRDHLVRRYWADPKAEVMFIGFFKDGEPAPQEFYPAPLAINLYPRGQRWPNACAVEVEVEPVTSAGPISGSRQRAGFRLKQSRGLVRVTIDVEPAEVAEVRAWCMPRELANLAKLGGYETMMRAAAELSGFAGQEGPLRRAANDGDRKAAVTAIANSLEALSEGNILYRDTEDEIHSSLFGTVTLHDGADMVAFRPSCLSPLHGINHSSTFEAVHAVAQPLKAPEITSFWMVHELNKKEDEKEDCSKGSLSLPDDPHFKRWRTGLLDNTLPDAKSDPRQRRNSQRVLLGGMIGFDRRSTSELRLSARWSDFSPKMPVIQDPKTQIYQARPVEKIYDMADLSGLAYELGAGREDVIDLTKTEGGQVRLMTLELESTRATRLRISATAVSRFSRYYKEEMSSELLRLAGDEIEMWLPSTRRPDEPKLTGVESAIQFGAEGMSAMPKANMTVLTSARRAVRLRIDLGKQWNSSGEGEQLGVVCFPTQIGNRSDLGATTYLGTENSGFAGFTAWGRDPIFETGELGRYVTTDQFVNAADAVMARIPVALCDDGQSVTQHARCDLALFDVSCDPDNGNFYADIEVDPEESYNAFIRLQLVRHQACALTGLETSTAAPLMASLLPAREVRILQTDRGFELSYSGVTYRNMSGSCSAAAETLPQTPHLDVFVLRDANGLATGASGLPVEAPGYGVIQEASALELRPDMSGDIGTWRLEVTEEPQPHPNIRSIQIAPGNLTDGVLVLMRESETYLSDPVIERKSRDGTPIMLQTVNRAVASISVRLNRKMPGGGAGGKD